MRIEIPELCVIALVGASGSGKSTFAKKYFKPTEILSSDFFRGMVSDDENDQSATQAAFDCLHFTAAKRLEAGKLTVIDATNVQAKARSPIIRLAKEQNCLAAALVLDMPEKLCIERNKARPHRNFGAGVVSSHRRDLRRSLRSLKKEGFRYVYTFSSPEEIEDLEIVRTKLWNDRREETGPFDIIGDIHGCYRELCALLERLGYQVDGDRGMAVPPPGRKAVFLGDYCDRGPKNLEVLRLVINMAEAGAALCLPGNHDVKLLKLLKGSPVALTYGLDITAEGIKHAEPAFVEKVTAFLEGLVGHYMLDGGKLAVAHAGIKEKFQGRASSAVRAFCLYGETTGETDSFGLPVRLNWADEYRGRALVVYGHTPGAEVQRINSTLCIDTGCVFGGALTAYRYPEDETVSVKAAGQYYAPVKPLAAEAPAEDSLSPVLDISGVTGSRRISTRLMRDIVIEEEESASALELMSRFSADPRWLIYLPPTMSPCGTSQEPDYLEHPHEAFDYFKRAGIMNVICEEKHMGSRGVMIVCRDEETAAGRFGVEKGKTPGAILSRTGRSFFDVSGAEDTQGAILARAADALEKSGFWEEFSTNWVCLDVEIMPWSAKARELLVEQYAPAGRAGREGLARAVSALRLAAENGRAVSLSASPGVEESLDLEALAADYEDRRVCLEKYTQAYRRYCGHVNSIEDYRIAPFHILATEGRVWNDADHLRHLYAVRDYLAAWDHLFINTDHLVLDLAEDGDAVDAGTAWWLQLTQAGAEGMVVKPLAFTASGSGGLAQPAVKCRGREYLRIIYGPEYTRRDRLDRLRKRSLSRKRRLALQEFALGMEALERFVRGEPLRRVHECVFATLALESGPVDPRL